MVFADIVGGANGIYKSTDTGATWTKVSNSTMDALIVSNATSNVEMSVGSAGQVYVAILNFGQLRNGGVFRSGDGGATWLAMDIPLTNEKRRLFRVFRDWYFPKRRRRRHLHAGLKGRRHRDRFAGRAFL